jgi:menaquinone-dependent protoporphyrinogen oxidase
MRVLIAYGTAKGQTRKIAEFLAQRFREQAHGVELCELSLRQSEPEPEHFDAIIVASPMLMGGYMRPVVRFAQHCRAELEAKPSAFVSVSMSAASDNQEEAQAELGKRVALFAKKTGWTPAKVEHVAGALAYTTYDFFTRWVMKRIAHSEGRDLPTTRDYEFTDWQALAAFADGFLASAQPAEQKAHVAMAA